MHQIEMDFSFLLVVSPLAVAVRVAAAKGMSHSFV